MAATSIPNKPLSMANISLTSLPAFLTSKPSLPHSLSIAPRPIRSLHLSSSSISPFLCAKKTLALIPFVAQTSDWAPDGSSDVVDEGDVALIHDDANWEGGEDQAVDSPSVAVAEGEADDAFVNEEEAATADDAFVDEEEADEPPEDAKLFVGNLPYELESETLAQLFEKAGVVEVAEVIYNRETDQSRGFGFVTMRTVEEAEKAVEMFHRYDANGRQLTVNKAAPRGSRPPVRSFEPSFRVYVGNLPWQVDGSRLEQVFSEHGKVVDARVVYDRETGRSRGFGFVTMESQNELDDAIAALDGQTLDGRAIRVNVAEERPRRGAF